MTCPQCRRRRGKRACPALGETICAVCCATKRLVAIRCPSDCAHLATAQAHPAAAVRRQQAADFDALLGPMGRMSEGQLRLFFLVLSYFLRPAPNGAPPLVDAEVADAAQAVGATFETASRGLIFEHQARTMVGQRMSAELLALLRDAGKGGGSRFEREVADVLLGIARAAAPRPLADPRSRPYLELAARVLGDGTSEAAVGKPTLIMP